MNLKPTAWILNFQVHPITLPFSFLCFPIPHQRASTARWPFGVFMCRLLGMKPGRKVEEAMQSVLYWKGQIENGCTISKVRNISISVGSSTVAMTMAAGIIAAMPGISELSPLYLACVTAAIAGGSTVCSHFNDSGFWLVKSLVGMDEKTTLKTWTIMETLVGGVGFLVALVISFFA